MDGIIKALTLWGCDTTGALERFVSDEKLYLTCLESFLKDEDSLKLQQSIKEENYIAAFEYAHALKGVTGNLGLTPLYQSASALTEILRAEKYTEVFPYEKNFLQAMAEFKRLMAEG